MRIPAIAFTLAILVACAGGDDDAPAMDEEAAPAAETAPADAAPTVADFAGTWDAQAMLEGSPDPVSVTLEGSADGSNWMMMLQDRDPIAARTSMSGDSLILVSEPYESVLREGVTVTVRTAAVMQDGGLVGKIVATYQTPDGDEVVNGTIEGSRGM